MRTLYPDRYVVFSAGTEPRGVNPYAVQVMAEIGLRARISLLRGDPEPAVRWLQTFDETPNPPSMLFFLEIPSITQNRVLIATGSDAGLRDAESRLAGLWEATQAVHNVCQMIHVMLLLSMTYRKQKRTDEALAVLRDEAARAEPGGFVRPFVELGQPMADLLKRLSKKDVAVDYIGELLAAFRGDEQVVVSEVSENRIASASPLSP